MKPRFDDPLKLAANGRKLEACGPLNWNDPNGPQNVNKVIVTVTITQGGVVAQGDSAELDHSVTEWMVDLRPGPGQKFQARRVEAIGRLRVTDPGGAQAGPDFNWEEQPNLELDPGIS